MNVSSIITFIKGNNKTIKTPCASVTTKWESIEDVISYQAKFASHHTHNPHVGFLFPQSGIGKHNEIGQNFSFSSYHNTKLQLCDKNISIHTRVKFEILLWS